MKHFMLLPAVFIFLSACNASTNYNAYLAKKGIAPPVPEKFSHCRSYGCKEIDQIQLDKKDWQEIKSLFTQPVSDAIIERKLIAKAIGVFEQKAGRLTGTEKDVAGTYVKVGRFQHDCVDESVNTTIYLSLLKQKGYLLYHDVAAPTARLFFTSLMPGPHQTAVIIDKQTQEFHAVDSWFHDNGHPAEIVALNEWYRGWHP